MVLTRGGAERYTLLMQAVVGRDRFSIIYMNAWSTTGATIRLPARGLLRDALVSPRLPLHGCGCAGRNQPESKETI